MNYLAHAVLSPQDAALLTGNLIADSVKGNLDHHQIHPPIKAGIALHRYIDTYTDSNRYVTQVNRILHPYFHHYSPVLSDIYFDHCLHRNWDLMMPDHTFYTYKQYIYQSLQNRQNYLPTHLLWMVQHDWLESYTTLLGIQQVCDRLQKRIKDNADLSNSATILEKHYTEIEKYFLLFFPLLQEACRQHIHYLKITK